MMWIDLLAALALVMVLEGITPFINPAGLRKSLLTMAQLDDASLRTMGLISMVLGLALLYWVRG
jgi:uncharacterized protein